MKGAIINLDVWSMPVIVLVGGTSDQLNAYAAPRGYPVTDNQTIGRCLFHDTEAPILWVKTLEDIPTLAHEVLHIVCYVMGRCGLVLSHESEEAYCYTLDHLVARIRTEKAWKTVKV